MIDARAQDPGFKENDLVGYGASLGNNSTFPIYKGDNGTSGHVLWRTTDYEFLRVYYCTFGEPNTQPLPMLREKGIALERMAVPHLMRKVRLEQHDEVGDHVEETIQGLPAPEDSTPPDTSGGNAAGDDELKGDQANDLNLPDVPDAADNQADSVPFSGKGDGNDDDLQ